MREWTAVSRRRPSCNPCQGTPVTHVSGLNKSPEGTVAPLAASGSRSPGARKGTWFTRQYWIVLAAIGRFDPKKKNIIYQYGTKR